MSIAHRLLLGTFMRYLGYAILGAVVLFTLVDVFERVGSFVDNHATASQVLRYYAYRAVWTIDLVLPIAMLMATLFAIGGMARYLELTALFSSGHSLLQVARPLLLVSVAAALLSLAWREYVLSEAVVRMDHIWEVEIHGRPDRLRPTQDIAILGSDQRFYYARRYDPNAELVTGLKVVSMQDAQVVERIDAARAEWTGSHWVLHDGSHRRFSGDGEAISRFERLPVSDLALSPEVLSRDRVKPEDMNIRQLLRHNRLVRQTGGDATRGEVDVQFLLAFPLVNVLVVFMGTILASGPRKTTVASGFGWTLLVSFGYYLFMNFGRALGHEGVLSPVVAGWSGNAAYAVLGMVLFLRARR
ncbi:MAG: LptF/LptG family permease [Candidatus Krumholzibacteriia bacterium]